MSDQNQILRLLGTIREECAEIRSRQEELYELLISYKDQLHDLKRTVVEKLEGLPRSPYVAGQLVPAPERVDGIEDFRQLLATYLHRYHPDSPPIPTDAVYDPPAEVRPEDITLEAGEDRPSRAKRRGGGGGGGESRPRDMDLERGPDRDIEEIDLSDDGDEEEEGEGTGEGSGNRRRRRRRRRRRGSEQKVESSGDGDD